MTKPRIAVCIMVTLKEGDDRVDIKTIANEDPISEGIARMLSEQVTNVIQYIDAATRCAEGIKASQEQKP
jgi:hypothetical protein